MFIAHRRKGGWYGGRGRRNGGGWCSCSCSMVCDGHAPQHTKLALLMVTVFSCLKTESNFTFSSIPIDYNLYRKFWTLQDYFRNPVQCYEKFSWMTFLKVMRPSTQAEEHFLPCSFFYQITLIPKQVSQMWIPFCRPQYSDETLAVFKSYKLDDMQASKRKLEELRASGGEHVYFAKFLTSEKVRKLFFTSSTWSISILK